MNENRGIRTNVMLDNESRAELDILSLSSGRSKSEIMRTLIMNFGHCLNYKQAKLKQGRPKKYTHRIEAINAMKGVD